VGVFDTVDVLVVLSVNLSMFGEHKIEYGSLGLVQLWLINGGKTELFNLTVRSWDLQEGINLSNSWNEVRNERLELSIDFNYLWRVAIKS
jgi:hypothetical protein